MSLLAAYMCTPRPPADGPPLPAMVYRPSSQSVGASGSGSGFQRNCSGVTGPWPKSLWKRGCARAENGPCTAAGRIRYSQLRRLAARGAVKAVPLSCSAYKPYGHFCGEFRPAGKAPGSASVANSFPNPLKYWRLIWDSVEALQHAAAHLVAFDGFEQGLEVALAEALVALALDDLEEDRAEGVLGEDLQQLALLGLRVGIDQDAVPAQAFHILAVVRDALVDHLEIGVRGVEELHAGLVHGLHRGIDVVGEQGDVLDALAVVLAQVFVDLALLVAGLVQRNADDAVGGGHGLGQQAGLGALDVEVADLAEVEQLLVVVRPLLHVAQEQVVGEVVDEGQAEAARVLLHARDRLVVGVDVVTAVVDQVEHAVADALDHREVDRAGVGLVLHLLAAV